MVLVAARLLFENLTEIRAVRKVKPWASPTCEIVNRAGSTITVIRCNHEAALHIMKRRDLIKLAIGSAAAAVVLPEVVKAIPAGTPLNEIFPDGIVASRGIITRPYGGIGGIPGRWTIRAADMTKTAGPLTRCHMENFKRITIERANRERI